MDKNPRQITRLRVEDQAKLEKLARVTGFDEGEDTPQFDSLYVDGSLVANNLYLYETIDFPGSASLKYSEEDSEFIFSNVETEFSAHLPLSHAEEEILTDKNVKTLFGNQTLYGSGNIDLYRHQLQFKDGKTLYFAEIISSSNLKIDSLQDLTTLTKATTNFKIVLYDETDAGANEILIYSGSIWEYDIAGEAATFTTITDVVTTI